MLGTNNQKRRKRVHISTWHVTTVTSNSQLKECVQANKEAFLIHPSLSICLCHALSLSGGKGKSWECTLLNWCLIYRSTIWIPAIFPSLSVQGSRKRSAPSSQTHREYRGLAKKSSFCTYGWRRRSIWGTWEVGGENRRVFSGKQLI